MVVIADPRPTPLPPIGYASAEAAWATGSFPGSTTRTWTGCCAD
jgi:hypothetical protein